uniref:Uncharacterized protein n=1 Tax=Anguilla anguilla TaxID=7936 RepID=A0A0E9WIS7_ANGAN
MNRNRTNRTDKTNNLHTHSGSLTKWDTTSSHGSTSCLGERPPLPVWVKGLGVGEGTGRSGLSGNQ